MADDEWVCFLTSVTCGLLQDSAGGTLLPSIVSPGGLHGRWTQTLSPQARLPAVGCRGSMVRKGGRGFLSSLSGALTHRRASLFHPRDPLLTLPLLHLFWLHWFPCWSLRCRQSHRRALALATPP